MTLPCLLSYPKSQFNYNRTESSYESYIYSSPMDQTGKKNPYSHLSIPEYNNIVIQ